ncbi:hypothetical protein B9Y61_18875 [Stenotrophomonas maltophilia]|uniref:hypothetical protein n=1 Tax=Stenotrophomonas maltophilia TaxID=40324 RepID=UPI000C259F00|nr:hypothetical protein [Stenotrophomonas maltophilia]PJL65897.1 hypothetical protein B9Y61_18875 [Stenotrophomonas maltophilia]HDS1214003.1 hypothetical protein [Stenotrophomonas maltophilia]
MKFTTLDIGGFIDEVESSRYADLVREHFNERGRILDGGCFVGSSTRSLLEGLSAGGARNAGTPPVIAIDRFVVADEYLLEFFASRAIDIRFGESFLPVFNRNVDPLQGLVEVRAGEVQRVGRIVDAIDIMVVDVAKSMGINAFICANWLPQLVVGGHLVHQDFYAPSHAWIAASMGMILDRFSVTEVKAGESAIFRLEAPLRAADIKAAASVVPWSVEGISSLRRVEEAMGAFEAAPLRIMRALALRRMGHLEAAFDLANELLSLEDVPNDRKWKQWLGMMLMAMDPCTVREVRTLADVYLQDVGARSGE